MNAIAALVACSCLVSSSAGRRSGINEAHLGVEGGDGLTEAERTVERIVEDVDVSLTNAPKAEAETWATVSSVSQIGPTLDDIVPRASVNYLITTEGAAPSDSTGDYWLEANLSAIDGFSCNAFTSKVDRLMQALKPLNPPELFKMYCWEEQLTILSVHRPLPPGADAAVQMFARHLKHMNYTESTLMDADTMLEDKDRPILEEVLQGFRFEMDVALTKALEEVIAARLTEYTHRYDSSPSGPSVDRGTCGVGESPCRYQSWEGPCCSTRSCLEPTSPESNYPRYQEDQCLFNGTECWEYCKERFQMKQQATKEMVQSVVSMFKGASSDLRLSYDDSKRRELLRTVPFLNMSFNDVVAKLSVPLEHVKMSMNAAQQPWLGPLADVLEGATIDLDTLDSVSIKNLPGVKVQMTFADVHPFKVLGSLLQDLGVLKLMHKAAEAEETLQKAEEAVEEAVLKAEAPIEHVVESIERELPEVMPSEQQKLIPMKATISMGPSLGHFDTNENVSYMFFHGDKGSSDPSAGYRIELNVTATDAEAAASFVELCNGLLARAPLGPVVEVRNDGSQVSILSQPLLPPNKAAIDAQIKMIMSHVGHLTFNMSANNNIEQMMAHPDDSIWKEAKTGTRMMLDATLTEAVEKAILDRIKKRPSAPSSSCGSMEAPCLDKDEGMCCSLATCLHDDGSSEDSEGTWKDTQCRYNFTCAPLCPEHQVGHDYSQALAEKLVQLFAGGSMDVRVAYDEEMVQGLMASVPFLNMTFRSLQDMYRLNAQQYHLENFAGHPLAALGVELLNATNKYLVSVESVEVKNLPDDIKIMIKLDNAKPFQFMFALAEGSGILGMLSGSGSEGHATP
ncbi:Wrap73 [Symbiodinium sp. CCMP2592]|nr:Wrap73 [Symbiodinium sp. CCMP2592]